MAVSKTREVVGTGKDQKVIETKDFSDRTVTNVYKSNYVVNKLESQTVTRK